MIFIIQIRDGEPFAAGVTFFPMHRLERLELDLPEAAFHRWPSASPKKPGRIQPRFWSANFSLPRPKTRATTKATQKATSPRAIPPEPPAGDLRQILTAPNQLTLLRMIFLPFIVINLVKHDFKWALALFVLAGLSDGLDGLLARTLHQQTVLASISTRSPTNCS